MPVHTNSIGDFEFLSLEGAFYLRQQQKELIERAGVDGSGARRLGRRGRPFEVLTVNYEESLESAHDKMLQYIELANDDPVTVIQASVDKGTYLVLEVRERVPAYAIFPSLGGLVGGEEACHEVVWVLLG